MGRLNTLGKVCVVFVAAASLAFAAFAAAMRNGGPNWESEADALGPDFVVTITPGDPPTYGVVYRPTNENVSSSKVLAEAVTAARAKQVAETRNKLTKLQELANQFKPQIELANAANAADEAGLKVREEALVRQLNEVSQAVQQLNDQIIEAAAKAQAIRAEGQERREEVYRQKNVLELARNDLYAAKEQRKNLEEEELRLKELLQRLERRRQQLLEKTSSSGYGTEK